MGQLPTGARPRLSWPARSLVGMDPANVTVPRGAARPRRAAREPFDETDDEEVLTLVVSALMYYANTR